MCTDIITLISVTGQPSFKQSALWSSLELNINAHDASASSTWHNKHFQRCLLSH